MLENLQNSTPLLVFGAQVVEAGSVAAVCGGVGQVPTSQGQAITFVTISGNPRQFIQVSSSSEVGQHWPFMIGASVLSLDRRLFVFGGGATCFSMGTFWESGIYSAKIPDNLFEIAYPTSSGLPINLKYLESPRIASSSNEIAETTGLGDKATLISIPRVSLESHGDFQEILRNRNPVVIEGLKLGGCVENWTPDYLAERLGRTKQVSGFHDLIQGVEIVLTVKVIVHECQMDTEKMDFNSKNFRYITDTFGSFIGRAQKGERLYLRSLSEQKPSETPANLHEDFPSLGADFMLPEELQYVRDNLFSSVLRISGRVNMWLHYDVS